MNPRFAAPKDKPFESFWSAGSGWGSFTHTSGRLNKFTLSVTEGSLYCHSLELAWTGSVKSVTSGKVDIPFRIDGPRLVFTADLTLNPGGSLSVNG